MFENPNAYNKKMKQHFKPEEDFRCLMLFFFEFAVLNETLKADLKLVKSRVKCRAE